MKIITAAFLSVILFISLALLPAIGSAQDVVQSSGAYSNSAADSGSTLLEGSTTTTGSSNKFDPMWLLPLLIVPIAYIIYKAANNDLTTTEFGGSSIVGAKGGKAIKESDIEDFDE